MKVDERRFTMYWDDICKCFSEVASAKNNGMDEVFELSERCREQLLELLDDEGALILEKYIACLDLLSKRSDFSDKIYHCDDE